MIKLDVKSLVKFGKKLDAMRSRVEDLSPVTAVFAEEMKSVIDDSFESGTSPTGKQWVRLKPKTQRQKAHLGFSATPLTRTGALRNRIATKGTKAGILAGISPTTPYGLMHQFGGGHVPARPFLPFDQGHKFIAKGPAKSFLVRLRKAVKKFITTGKVISG